jgi:hypothetical protein
MGAVLVPDAIAIAVGLATLDLGALLCAGSIATTTRSASLRKPVNGQKNHGSGKKCAVFQQGSHGTAPLMCLFSKTARAG